MNLPLVSMREKESKLVEKLQWIKRTEEELRTREIALGEREQAVREKEIKIMEKELMFSELLKSSQYVNMTGGHGNNGDQSHKNNELLRSLQRLASTRGGESSLAGSERVSLGSKLKESKMSAVSFSGFDNSGGSNSHQKHTLHKFKSDPEFLTMEEAQKQLLLL